MEDSQNNTNSIFNGITRVLGFTLFFVLIAVLCIVGFVFWTVKSCSFGAKDEGKISLTPTQITKIQDIGQWEFLSVSDEELMDTVRHGFFGDDELARIYYGTLRLGIDLNDAQEGWITTDKDTVCVLLPPIKLLDNRFLDEAQTQAFYESGNWSEAAKAQLTRRAAQKMKLRCLTEANIRSAERNAIDQFSTLLRSMGYEYSKVRFREEPQKKHSFWKP